MAAKIQALFVLIIVLATFAVMFLKNKLISKFQCNIPTAKLLFLNFQMLTHSQQMERISKNSEQSIEKVYLANAVFPKGVNETVINCAYCGGYSREGCAGECGRRGYRCYGCLDCYCACGNDC